MTINFITDPTLAKSKVMTELTKNETAQVDLDQNELDSVQPVLESNLS